MKKYSFLFLISIIISSVSTYSQVGLQNIKICVISDTHYFDSTLLINDGPAFQMNWALDGNLLKESRAIMVSLFDSLISEHPDIVLITGDLTKDGELINHQKMLNFFQQLTAANIKVFVTPGNHDINNPMAFSFDNDTMYTVPTIGPVQFKTMYNNYGYSQALKTDTASLSYVAEPIVGLQILSMDVCRYDSNLYYSQSVTNGGFKPHVLQWVKDRLQEAKQSGKVVLGMQHHNMLEHYMGQKSIFSEYVIDDYDTISSQLADLGLKIVFTGHYHAQDIVEKTTSLGNSIFDVETGSAITYPCPYRITYLATDTMLHITGKHIEHINYNTDTLTFQEYALQSIQSVLPPQIIYMLMSPPYTVDSATAYAIEPAITETFIAHFGGNEGTPTPQTQATITMLESSPYASIGYILDGIWTDLAPDDWTTDIDLNNPINIGVAETLNLNRIFLFPNPSMGVFNLILPDVKCNIEIKVFDLDGKLIYDRAPKDNRNIVIDISDQSSGQYVIQLRINKSIISKKLLKL
ncbi:MAG: metallophosphoesterase [Bacteroidota bacterium]